MCPDIGLSGRDDLIADGDVLFQFSIEVSADADCLSGLFDRRIRFDSADGTFDVVDGEESVVRCIDFPVNFDPVAGTFLDIDTAGPGRDVEIHRAGDI